MNTRLYPRQLTHNVAQVELSAGTVTLLDRAGTRRTYTIRDEARLIAYCQTHNLPLVKRQPAPPNRMENAEAGANHPADKQRSKPQPAEGQATSGRIKLSEKAQASLEKVIQKFQAGDLSPITRAVRLQLPADAPASKWTLSNRVLAFVQCGDLDVRGYRQWQAAGRQVRKGARAIYILRPRTIKKTKQVGGREVEKTICIGFAPLPVFGLSQTEGEESPPDYQPQALPPLAEAAQRLGVDLTYSPLPPGLWGSYSPGEDRIRLGTHDEATWFHELAHAAHGRLEELKGGQDSQQETVAEFTAAVLMELYGLRDYSGNAWDYISHYASEPLVAITKALSTVEAVLVLLLGEPVE